MRCAGDLKIWLVLIPGGVVSNVTIPTFPTTLLVLIPPVVILLICVDTPVYVVAEPTEFTIMIDPGIVTTKSPVTSRSLFNSKNSCIFESM